MKNYMNVKAIIYGILDDGYSTVNIGLPESPTKTQ